MKPRQIAVGVAGAGLVGAFWLALQGPVRSRQNAICQSNLRQVGYAMGIYIRDYDEKFPMARNWADVLRPYVAGFGASKRSPAQIEALFRCPTSGSFYVYNGNLAGVSYARINSKVPRIYETSAGHNAPNQSDGGAVWSATPVHQTPRASGSNALFDFNQVVLSATKPAFPRFAPLPIAKPKRAQTP